ncbi:tripartite tricarboxylate transporter permease [Amorphus sp. 3PC139-8]|uniref:tripartite tricarboxylate transporter permease n=1 Tax=Amorphus sp. 3PC139-8 TaxID=2735676 RepID=UPI00345C73F8
MFDALLSGASLVFVWPAPALLLAGICIGLCLGVVPGLSGLTGMSILLPYTFTMETGPAMAFLLGMFSVTTTSDTLASVLLGVPGTAASQATILDGFPMAQRGEAPRAFGAAFTVSAIGGVLGALGLALSIPIVKPLIMSFAAPEFVMLGLLGLVMVGSLSGRSILTGLAAATFGLLISMVGYAPQGAIPRYDFGFIYLLDGLPLVPVVLGLFAVPEIIDLSRHGRSIARDRPSSENRATLFDGVKDAGRNWWLVLRCGALGTYIGMLPGLGGAIVDWIAYGHAVQTSRNNDNFGKGDVRGVIAPETANNAAKGGALIPTLVFGIPGSPPMAILLGAFLIQGLTPGPAMLSYHLDVTMSLVIILVIANVLGAIALMIWSKQLARLAYVPGRMLVPGVTLFVLMGAWMTGNQMGDWITLVAFGGLGVVMKRAGWSRPAFILGFIIGPIIETSLHLAMQIHGFSWLTRPACLVLGGIVVLTVATSVYREVKKRRAKTEADAAPKRASDQWISGDPPSVAATSAILGLIVAAGAAFAVWRSFEWPWDSRFFPLFSAAPLVLLALGAAVRDAATLRDRPVGVASLAGDWRDGATLLWLTAIVLLSYLIYQPLAIVLAMASYTLIALKGRWKLALAQAVCGWLILVFVFGRLGGVLWHPTLISF